MAAPNPEAALERMLNFFRSHLLLKRYRHIHVAQNADVAGDVLETIRSVEECEAEFHKVLEEAVGVVMRGERLDAVRWANRCAAFGMKYKAVTHWVCPQKFRWSLTKEVGAEWVREDAVPEHLEQPPREKQAAKHPAEEMRHTCVVCNVTCNSVAQYYCHLEGRLHRNMLRTKEAAGGKGPSADPTALPISVSPAQGRPPQYESPVSQESTNVGESDPRTTASDDSTELGWRSILASVSKVGQQRGESSVLEQVSIGSKTPASAEGGQLCPGAASVPDEDTAASPIEEIVTGRRLMSQDMNLSSNSSTGTPPDSTTHYHTSDSGPPPLIEESDTPPSRESAQLNNNDSSSSNDMPLLEDMPISVMSPADPVREAAQRVVARVLRGMTRRVQLGVLHSLLRRLRHEHMLSGSEIAQVSTASSDTITRDDGVVNLDAWTAAMVMVTSQRNHVKMMYLVVAIDRHLKADDNAVDCERTVLANVADALVEAAGVYPCDADAAVFLDHVGAVCTLLSQRDGDFVFTMQDAMQRAASKAALSADRMTNLSVLACGLCINIGLASRELLRIVQRLCVDSHLEERHLMSVVRAMHDAALYPHRIRIITLIANSASQLFSDDVLLALATI